MHGVFRPHIPAMHLSTTRLSGIYNARCMCVSYIHMPSQQGLWKKKPGTPRHRSGHSPLNVNVSWVQLRLTDCACRRFIVLIRYDR